MNKKHGRRSNSCETVLQQIFQQSYDKEISPQLSKNAFDSFIFKDRLTRNKIHVSNIQKSTLRSSTLELKRSHHDKLLADSLEFYKGTKNFEKKSLKSKLYCSNQKLSAPERFGVSSGTRSHQHQRKGSFSHNGKRQSSTTHSKRNIEHTGSINRQSTTNRGRSRQKLHHNQADTFSPEVQQMFEHINEVGEGFLQKAFRTNGQYLIEPRDQKPLFAPLRKSRKYIKKEDYLKTEPSAPYEDVFRNIVSYQLPQSDHPTGCDKQLCNGCGHGNSQSSCSQCRTQHSSTRKGVKISNPGKINIQQLLMHQKVSQDKPIKYPLAACKNGELKRKQFQLDPAPPPSSPEEKALLQSIKQNLFYAAKGQILAQPSLLYTRDCTNNTILHLAAKMDNLNLFKLILKEGGVWMLGEKNTLGKTPEEMAKAYRSLEVQAFCLAGMVE